MIEHPAKGQGGMRCPSCAWHVTYTILRHSINACAIETRCDYCGYMLCYDETTYVDWDRLERCASLPPKNETQNKL